MEVKSFVLGVSAVLIVVGLAAFALKQEYSSYSCFQVESEKNLSKFSLSGLKAECDPEVSVRLCRIIDVYQIGRKIVNGPMLAVQWNRTVAAETMRSVSWEGLEEVDCPEDIENLKEKILDDTKYQKGNL